MAASTPSGHAERALRDLCIAVVKTKEFIGRPGGCETRRVFAQMDGNGYRAGGVENFPHPDEAEILAVLDGFVNAISKWTDRRGGGI